MRTLAAAGVLTTFIVLFVVLLKNQVDEIPTRDVATSFILMASSLLAVVSGLVTQAADGKKTTPSPRQESFQRVSNKLMNLEILFTLVLPWLLLKSSSFIQHQLQLVPETDRIIEYLLVPHLYFFQAQIVGESMLFVSHRNELVFPYTCVANALRAFPLATWIQRAIVVLHQIQLFNPFHWLLVAGLPMAASVLWLYSSLILIPLKWYPVIRDERQTATHIDQD